MAAAWQCGSVIWGCWEWGRWGYWGHWGYWE